MLGSCRLTDAEDFGPIFVMLDSPLGNGLVPRGYYLGIGGVFGTNGFCNV